ncbi:MAG: DUF1996 domain-containing protein, partial [Acidimicrobiia bacterium]|nr:DUF1996 domain-containing protein [Acidimicrobiia bacterium]
GSNRRRLLLLAILVAATAWMGYQLSDEISPMNVSSERPNLLPAAQAGDTEADAISGPLDLSSATERITIFAGAEATTVTVAEPATGPEPGPLDPKVLAAFGRAEVDIEQLAADNLATIKAASVRNRNHDSSPYAATPMADLVMENHFGPRSDYLGKPAGNPEHSFPTKKGGQFRTSCEFSHFAYDDPLVHPNVPGASHLHMFFGNTDVNAFTTYDSLADSGSSTCNGQELNRTGYWVPAMFDSQGNVRVPDRILIYYKGEGRARGGSEVYPEGAAMIAKQNFNVLPSEKGGIGGSKFTFLCSDNFSTNSSNGGQTMPTCQGDKFAADPGRWTVLEVSVKFPQCWNGQDPSNIDNFAPPQGNWYGSNCGGGFDHILPNLEYFVSYRVEPGEDTSGWFLASDVDPVSFSLGGEPAGATSHGDWWGAWHPDVNRMWIDNCVNYTNPSAASGCGNGYLTDGGPNRHTPIDGPALKFRPQFEGPWKVPASTLFAELCPQAERTFSSAADAAFCTPGGPPATGGNAMAGHNHGG